MTTESQAAFLADVGMRVRLLRTVRRMSQDRLADVAGVSRVTLGEVERGEHGAGILRYRAVAAALAVPLGSLFDGNRDPAMLVRTTAPRTQR